MMFLLLLPWCVPFAEVLYPSGSLAHPTVLLVPFLAALLRRDAGVCSSNASPTWRIPRESWLEEFTARACR
uniref:Putative secreted protein n=1 Tax=Anopheles marajoara TaxID=58244 RepID=A0A2M4CE79_9DIPT